MDDQTVMVLRAVLGFVVLLFTLMAIVAQRKNTHSVENSMIIMAVGVTAFAIVIGIPL